MPASVPPAPLWGPYAKLYPGASCLVDRAHGVRWDCTVFPAFYRGPVTVPCHRWDTGFNPAWAAPDLSAYAYDFEPSLWRDQLGVEVAYARRSENTMGFRATLANRGDATRLLALHVFAGLALPWVKPGAAPEAAAAAGPARLRARAGDHWLPGTGYARIERVAAGPRDDLPYDAVIPGETSADGAVGGFELRWDLKSRRGATLRFVGPEGAAERRCFARLRAAEGAQGVLEIFEADKNLRLEVPVSGSGAWTWCELPALESRFGLRWRSEAELALNGFVFTPHDTPPLVEPMGWDIKPLEQVDLSPRARLVRYGGLGEDRWCGIAFEGAEGHWREFHGAALEEMVPTTVHEHVRREFRGAGAGHFLNAFLHYVPVPARGETQVTGLFAFGSRAEVESALRAASWPHELRAQIDAAGVTHGAAFTPYQPVDYARTRLAATLLTNIVYPVRRFGEWFAHRSPGKWWDSLYTWDSGFIGLGLLELAPALAQELLDHYLCPPENPHAAFVHHGSLVPTQAFLAQEIWARTQDRAWLRRVLPALRRYYRFYTGREGSSTLATLRSGLLRPWDYFYNSGGWDDYPPQKAMWADPDKTLHQRIAPVATTAMAIRFARLLADFEALAEDTTAGEARLDYVADIARFTAALRCHAWDEEAGVFSYVVHDEAGEARGSYRHVSGQNFNRGLDGALPLMAGACTPAQRARLMETLFDPRRLWTGCGLTAVDQSAAYFRADGYWNGTVWLPYQWVFWKTMLDLGEADRALQIAQTALSLHSESTAATGRCYEHFLVANRQGAGWHHFGGLSAPALSFHAALHTPGRITTGFDCVVDSDSGPGANGGERRVRFRRSGGEGACALVVVPEAETKGRAPRVTCDGHPLVCRPHGPVAWAVLLPADARSGELFFAPDV